jgi:hypothetical protein
MAVYSPSKEPPRRSTQNITSQHGQSWTRSGEPPRPSRTGATGGWRNVTFTSSSPTPMSDFRQGPRTVGLSASVGECRWSH